jgi:hypothetical protein
MPLPELNLSTSICVLGPRYESQKTQGTDLVNLKHLRIRCGDSSERTMHARFCIVPWLARPKLDAEDTADSLITEDPGGPTSCKLKHLRIRFEDRCSQRAIQAGILYCAVGLRTLDVKDTDDFCLHHSITTLRNRRNLDDSRREGEG